MNLYRALGDSEDDDDNQTGMNATYYYEMLAFFSEVGGDDDEGGDARLTYINDQNQLFLYLKDVELNTATMSGNIKIDDVAVVDGDLAGSYSEETGLSTIQMSNVMSVNDSTDVSFVGLKDTEGNFIYSSLAVGINFEEVGTWYETWEADDGPPFITDGDIASWVISFVSDPTKTYNSGGDIPEIFESLLFPYADIMWEFQGLMGDSMHDDLEGSEMLYAGDETKLYTMIQRMIKQKLALRN